MLLLWIISVSYASCWCVYDVGVCCNVVSVLCNLVVTCWERADLFAVVFGVICHLPNVSWSTSESRVRLTPCVQFKPSSKIFLMTVLRRFFFCGPFVLFIFCVCHDFASVHCCLVVTCLVMADLLALVCEVYCDFVTFPCGILCQVWYLIVLIPDLYRLSYFFPIFFKVLVTIPVFRLLCPCIFKFWLPPLPPIVSKIWFPYKY